MKSNRLFGIIYILLSKDTVTASYLADYFEVSVRTIYRDIDTLSSLNIPIYASKGKNGGISLLDNYKLDKTLLTEEEQKEILFSLQSIDKLNLNDTKLFDKMKTIFSSKEDDWFSVDFNIWDNSDTHKINFETIKKAILKCQVIEFNYSNTYGETSFRVVEPIKLHFKYNAWYLEAFDLTKEDFRVFKLTRIKDINLLPDTFERKEIPKYPENLKPPKITKVILEIDESATYRVYDEFKEKEITKLDNGNFQVEIELPENEWLYGYILSFGHHAKVISPNHIKEIIKSEITHSLENYK